MHYKKRQILSVYATEVHINELASSVTSKKKESLCLCPIISGTSVIAQKTVREWRMRSPSSKINGMTLLEKSWCHFEVLLCVALAIRIKLFLPIKAFLFFQVI